MNTAVYKTKQRSVIEQYIKQAPEEHFTVDSLCLLLESGGESVGRTTVYRCLERLVGEGRMRKYQPSPKESACYQYIEPTSCCHEHFHLKCEKCGRLIHMRCERMDEMAKHINSHHGFKINHLKTMLYGICEECS